MRWGMVFRSAHLAELTDDDHDLLRRIGIKLVCDFRTVEEADAQPDRLPKDGSMAYLHMPIAHGKFDPAEAIGRIKKGDISWLTDDFMTNNYLKQIDDFADLWGQFFQRLMDSQNRPLVFHCTAGKDRTGICAALILLTAGVPESTVLSDHALSNIYNAQVINRIKQEIRKFGIDPEDMRSYLSAPRESMEAVLALGGRGEKPCAHCTFGTFVNCQLSSSSLIGKNDRRISSQAFQICYRRGYLMLNRP